MHALQPFSLHLLFHVFVPIRLRWALHGCEPIRLRVPRDAFVLVCLCVADHTFRWISLDRAYSTRLPIGLHLDLRSWQRLRLHSHVSSRYRLRLHLDLRSRRRLRLHLHISLRHCLRLRLDIRYRQRLRFCLRSHLRIRHHLRLRLRLGHLGLLSYVFGLHHVDPPRHFLRDDRGKLRHLHRAIGLRHRLGLARDHLHHLLDVRGQLGAYELVRRGRRDRRR